MKETGEQMKRLMEKIQMPEEGIAQLLEARKELPSYWLPLNREYESG